MNPFDLIKNGALKIINSGSSALKSAESGLSNAKTSFDNFSEGLYSGVNSVAKDIITPSKIYTNKSPEQQVAETNLGIKTGKDFSPAPQKKVEFSNPIPTILGGSIQKPTGREVVPAVNVPKKNTNLVQDVVDTAKSMTFNDLFGNVKKIVGGDPMARAEAKQMEKDYGVRPSFQQSIVNDGLLPSLGKTDSEKVSDRYQALFDAGIDSQRAEKIAYADAFKNKTNGDFKQNQENEQKYADLNVTPEEEKALRWTKIKEIGGLALDVAGNTPVSLGSLKFLKPLAKTIAETNDLKVITRELLDSGMPEHIANQVAPQFVNITDEAKVASKIKNIAESYKADPTIYGTATKKEYPDLVYEIAKEKDPEKIKVLLESTGVDKSQYDTMSKVLSATDNPKRVTNVIEGFTKIPEKKVVVPFTKETPKFEDYGIYSIPEQEQRYKKFIEPELNKIKEVKPDEQIIYHNGGGEDLKTGDYVNTNLKEAFTYPVDENSITKKVKKSELVSTGDPEKDAIGYRKYQPIEKVKPEVKLVGEDAKKVEDLKQKLTDLDQEEFEKSFHVEQEASALEDLAAEVESYVSLKDYKEFAYHGADIEAGGRRKEVYDPVKGQKFRVQKRLNQLSRDVEMLGASDGGAHGEGSTGAIAKIDDLISRQKQLAQSKRDLKEVAKDIKIKKREILSQIKEVEKKAKTIETSKIIEEKFFQKQAEKSAKLIEEEKIAKIKAEQRIVKQEEISKQLEETQKRLLDEKEYKIRQKELIAQARKPEIPTDTIGGRIRRAFRKTMFPIKNVDQKTQGIFQNWKRQLIVTKELAQEQFLKLAIPKEQGMKIINDFQAGIKTPYTEDIKKIFDVLFKEAKEKGFDFRYRSNYLPQVYKETPAEIRQKIEEYLSSKGLEDKMIQDYLDGVAELPEEISRTLKLNPSFEKERTFPTYEIAKEYGLTPKYENPAQLAAHYKEQMETAYANKKFIQQLAEEGKVLKEADAPRNWAEIKLKLDGDRYFAKPEFAEIINGQLTELKDLGITGLAVKGIANTSKFMQEMALSAGVPKSTLNFFTIGQAVKAMTAGDIKMAVEVLTRSNFNPLSIKYFTENADVIKQMANQGVDISKRIGNYKDVYETLGDKFKRKEYRDLIGSTFENLFNEKTFASFMPQMQISNFKQVFEKGIKQGMSKEEAEKFAGEVTKKFFGIFEDVGRSNQTNDGLTALFFAPRFREGMINVLANTGKSLTTELRNPIYYKNRRLAMGMAITYAAYNLLNKKLNGEYMWNNEAGKEFDLKIPYGEGKFVYIGFMPSVLSFVRSLASGGYNLLTGNTKVAAQKLGSVFSMPIKTGTDVITNSDYFDRPIYKDSDTGGTKVLKAGGYVLNSFNHTYIKEAIKQLQSDNKTPLLQSISAAMELPLKFSTQSKINQSNYFANLDKFNKENTRIKENNQKEMQPTFDKVQKLKAEGKVDEAKAIVDALNDDQYDTYKTMLTALKSKTTSQNKMNLTPVFQKIQELKNAGKLEEAGQIVDSLTDEEYKNYQALKKTFTTKQKISVSAE